MGRPLIICKKCKKKKEHHAHGKCDKCYRKGYNQPLIICKICRNKKHHHSFGLCSNCYMKKHKYHLIKGYNIRKYHNISLALWKRITKKCVICDFDKMVDLHHLDMDRNNNSKDNLIGLCPNHHKMLHDMGFKEEVENLLRNVRINHKI